MDGGVTPMEEIRASGSPGRVLVKIFTSTVS